MPSKTLTPTQEQIEELRNLFIAKYTKNPPAESFHPNDLHRIKNEDIWCTRFLEMYDLDMRTSMDKLWETCIWRKQYGANDLNENNIRKDYLMEGIIFTHNTDIDKKPLLVFKTKLHTRGSKDMDEMMKVVVYWIERIHRDTNLDKLTLVFDMAGTGLSNMDLDFIKRIIDNFKMYYPNALNYILIYEMAWVLNAAFKIIKGLLPAKALEILKMVTKKDITNFIDEQNCLTSWGGNDPYEFNFIPEKVEQVAITAKATESITVPSDVESVQSNSYKKVHFDESPGETLPVEQEDGLRLRKQIPNEMLRLSPNDYLAFPKGESNESNVEITCTNKIPVTYKIQTTSPEKFRVRPRSGILNPGETVNVSILLKTEHHLSESSKDKFLVMCIPVPQGMDLTAQQMSEVWKHKQFNSPEVEQHRLTCIYKDSGDSGRNGFPGGEKLDTKPAVVNSVSELTKHAQKLEKQLRFTQILQCITLICLLILSCAVVYLLKLQTSPFSQEDPISDGVVLSATSCPMGRRL